MNFGKITKIVILAAMLMLGCEQEEPMSSYSSSELKDLCLDLRAEMDALTTTINEEEGCSYLAAVSSDESLDENADCETAYQACLDEGPGQGDSPETWCDSYYNRSRFYDCEITAAEFEGCILESNEEMVHAMKITTCETLQDDNFSEIALSWMVPSKSCLKILQECPSWYR